MTVDDIEFHPVLQGGLSGIWKGKISLLEGDLGDPSYRSVFPCPKETFWEEIHLEGVCH